MSDVFAARTKVIAMLGARAPEKSVCPSEVARSLAGAETGEKWRHLMPVVHAAIDDLIADGAVQLTWKGKPLTARAGPYRIRRKDSH